MTKRFRSLRMTNGRTFRIGPATRSVCVLGAMGTGNGAWLHVNESGLAALEHAPAEDGTVVVEPLPPERVALILEDVNAARAATGNPPEVLPPAATKSLRHLTTNKSRFTVANATVAWAFPSTATEHAWQTLWVDRVTGNAMVSTETPMAPVPAAKFTHAPPPLPTWQRVTTPSAIAWLTANRYAVPPILAQRRTAKPAGVSDEPDAGRS